jgi:hypothetical protein
MRKQMLMLIGQLLVLVICVAFIKQSYVANLFPDKEAQQSFRQTECFLVNKKLAEIDQPVWQYRADFLISYNVNGTQYNRWVSGNGLDMSYNQDQEKQATILSHYAVGKIYVCWIDTKNPQMAILVPRHNWVSAFKLLIPSVMVILLLYSVLLSCARLLRVYKKQRGKRHW